MQRRGNKRAPRRRRAPRAGNPSADAVIPRPMRPLRTSRSFNLGTISPTVSDQGYGLNATLAQLPSFTEFTALFQEYRITWSSFDITYLPATTERYTPVFWYANYIAGGAGGFSLDEIMQFTGARKFAVGPDKRTLRVGFKPTVRTSDGIAVLRRSPWLAIASPGVAHSGIQMWFQHFNTSTALGSVISITATHQLEFRGSL